jgi:uncharacterized protein YqjF (DUF2071 family)
MSPERTFLTASWRDLVLLNYEVPRALLELLVPKGTELDPFEGRYLASVVGFRFLETSIRGWRVPFHQVFEEVNLRFYVVRHHAPDTRRRAVVFIRELVPKRAVAWLARIAYNEPYLRVPMHHRMTMSNNGSFPSTVEYGWTWAGQSFRLGGRLNTAPVPLVRPSEAEYITEHYWGYSQQRNGTTLEYRVEHPPWDVTDLAESYLLGNLAGLYGTPWSEVLRSPPRSAFYATGSAVAVFAGRALA